MLAARRRCAHLLGSLRRCGGSRRAARGASQPSKRLSAAKGLLCVFALWLVLNGVFFRFPPAITYIFAVRSPFQRNVSTVAKIERLV